MKNEVFIVHAYGGEYEDRWERIMKVFSNENKAKDWLKTQEEISTKYSKLIDKYVMVYDTILNDEERELRMQLDVENKNKDDIWYNVKEPENEDEFIKLVKKYHIKTSLTEDELKLLFSRVGSNTSDYDNYAFPFYSMEKHEVED